MKAGIPLGVTVRDATVEQEAAAIAVVKAIGTLSFPDAMAVLANISVRAFISMDVPREVAVGMFTKIWDTAAEIDRPRAKS